jgi:RNA polymerase sigma-70 factor (ECF subfamily)
MDEPPLNATPNGPERYNDIENVINCEVRALYARIRSIVKNDVDAEVAFEAFRVHALKKCDQFDPEKGELRAWLFRIAHNQAVSYVRKSNRHPHTSLNEDIDFPARFETGLDESAIDALIATENRERLRAAVDALAPQLCEVICLRYFEGRAVADVAALLGVSAKTVYSRLDAARTCLAATLADLQAV